MAGSLSFRFLIDCGACLGNEPSLDSKIFQQISHQNASNLYVVAAKWSKNVKVRTFGETNPENKKLLQTKVKLMLNLFFC